jgi:hypothetical protein
MKTNYNIIRALAGLTFLIFFCPFFQTCSDASIVKNNHKSEVYDEEREADKAYQDSLSKSFDANDKRLENGDFTTEEEAYLKKERKDWVFNAYEFAIAINKETFSKFKWEDLKEVGFYGSFIMPVVILLSLIIFACSFYNRFRLIFKVAVANLMLTLLLALLLYLDKNDFEALEMLRYGYYIFVINTLALIIVSYKATQKQLVI